MTAKTKSPAGLGSRHDRTVQEYQHDTYLPRRIGEALKHAYHGDLELHYDKAEDFVRVTWMR